jgi:hypothetical protein
VRGAVEAEPGTVTTPVDTQRDAEREAGHETGAQLSGARQSLDDRPPPGVIVEQGEPAQLPFVSGTMTLAEDVWERKLPSNSRRPVYTLIGRKGFSIKPAVARELASRRKPPPREAAP